MNYTTPYGSYNKKTRMKTLNTTNGKTITYNMDSKTARDTYEPVMRKDSKTGEVYFTNKQGNIRYVTEKRTQYSKNMAETDNAYTLVSKRRHPMEVIYADYANDLKKMANKARMEMVKTPRLQYDSNANKVYKNEVSALNVRLNEAKKNSIRERTAERLAASEINRRKELNPDLKGEDLRKVSQRMLTKYRQEVGAIPRKKRSINITDREWDAIQAGAISEHKLKEILDNSDPDVLRERAMPTDKKGLTKTQINRIKLMDKSNFTLAEIAKKLGIPKSTVSNVLKGVK